MKWSETNLRLKLQVDGREVGGAPVIHDSAGSSFSACAGGETHQSGIPIMCTVVNKVR